MVDYQIVFDLENVARRQTEFNCHFMALDDNLLPS